MYSRLLREQRQRAVQVVTDSRAFLTMLDMIPIVAQGLAIIIKQQLPFRTLERALKLNKKK